MNPHWPQQSLGQILDAHHPCHRDERGWCSSSLLLTMPMHLVLFALSVRVPQLPHLSRFQLNPRLYAIGVDASDVFESRGSMDAAPPILHLCHRGFAPFA